MFTQQKTMEMGVESNTSIHPLLNPAILNQPGLSLPVTSLYEPVETITSLSSDSFLGSLPIQNTYNMPSNDVQTMPPQGDWRSKGISPQDQYFGGSYSGNQTMMHEQMQRGMGPRSRNVYRVPCRHFIAGACRYGMRCAFLHPGVNAEPVTTLPSSTLVCPPLTQNLYNMTSSDVQNIATGGDWSKELSQPDNSGGNYSANRNMMQDQMQRGIAFHPRSSHRIPCRHFLAGGCRYGMKCSFLHAGINGPQM